jgi:hypothetical protein
LLSSGLIPWLDPVSLIHAFGPYALVGVCFIIFAETGLLVGFLLPGDTLLIITGLLAFHPGIGIPIWLVVPAIADTTTATSLPASTSRLTRQAALPIRSMSATDVPPNFWTIRAMLLSSRLLS